VTGRALLGDTKLRYVNVKIRDEKKIFGLHRMNPTERVYVTEGQFDSLFLPNAVASGDAHLLSLGDTLIGEHGCEDLVLVWDNTPRSREIVNKMNFAINLGYKVVMLPYDEDAKDLNEMVKGGMSLSDVKELIDTNVYTGLNAHLKLNEWRRC
jgi:hypothetical protein